MLIALIFAGVDEFHFVFFLRQRSRSRCTGRSRFLAMPCRAFTTSSARRAQQVGLPMPKVYLIPNDSPNAFGHGRIRTTRRVAATQGILVLLNYDELEAVLAP